MSEPEVSGSRAVTRFAVAARLKPGVQGLAAALIAKGPPFDLAALGFARHDVYLSYGEVFFVFEGSEVEWALDQFLDEDAHSAVFRDWRPLVEDVPRLARLHFHWELKESEPAQAAGA